MPSSVRLVLLIWLISPAWAQPQPAFQLQLLGVDPATQKIVIINVDTRSVIIDRTSATPVLSCGLGFQTGDGLMLDRRTSPPTLSALLSQISPPSVTYRAVFTFDTTSTTWKTPATMPTLPPNLTDLVQIHRNGLLVDGGYLIAYTPPAAGSPAGTQGILAILPTSPWDPADKVTAVWVFPLQSLFLTPAH